MWEASSEPTARELHGLKQSYIKRITEELESDCSQSSLPFFFLFAFLVNK